MSQSSHLHSTARGLVVLATLVGACLSLAPNSARAVDDPSLDYRTLTTPHFRVHYAKRWETFAHRVARVAEEAHQILVPLLANEPRLRTHIVVDDSADVANGSASVLGRNVIRILAQPPDPASVLGYYDDWLRILVYHEYVHVLHLETSSGLTSAINWVLGNQLHPNAALPRWYVEGLAVMHESERTGTGRTNSSLFRTWLRTAALSDQFFSLGATTGAPFRWPQGTTPYLYGGFFVQYIADKHGEDALTRFNHVYGSRLIPFSLNQTLESITGQTFHELWQEWEAHVQARALAERVAVEAAGRTELEYVTDAGGLHREPKRRPGTEQITFYTSGLASHARYAAARTSSTETDTLFEIEGADGSSDWTPSGDALVHSRLTIRENIYRYHDLYAWRPASGTTRRLTEGERATEPTVSPDGERLAYVRTETGTSELVLCELRRSQLQSCRAIVASGDEASPRWQQISGPVWAPDGERLVFSWWRLDRRHRDLWSYRPGAPKGERLRQLTDDAAQDVSPAFGPEGTLYFSSDRTGIYNIYARPPETGRTWQISNVVRGVFDPEVSHDGRWIYVSAYTDDGYELARFRRPTRLLDPAPSSYEAPLRRDYPDVATEDWTTGEYRPGRWLVPTQFMPSIGVLASGAGIGGTLTGSGPVGHHSWSLTGSWLSGPDFTERVANAGVQYRYGGWPVDLSLAGYYRERPRLRSFVYASRFVPLVEREVGGRLGLGYPLNRIDDQLSLNANLEVDRTFFRERPVPDPDPADVQPQWPEQGWSYRTGLSLAYGNLDRFPQSISVEEGYRGSLGVDVQRETAGEESTNSVFFNYSLQGYQPNPLWRRHVFGVEMSGGITRANGQGGGQFSIGGHSPQNVLSSILFQSPRGNFVVRGYPPGATSGSQYQVWTASYRFPLAFFDKGFSTVPAFFGNLKGDVFFDAGGAFDDLLGEVDLRKSLGAEVMLGTRFGYYFAGQLRVGFAHGFNEDGINEWYLLYGGGF